MSGLNDIEYCDTQEGDTQETIQAPNLAYGKSRSDRAYSSAVEIYQRKEYVDDGKSNVQAHVVTYITSNP